MSFKRTSRAALYDSESEIESDDGSNPLSYMPKMEFEFVEVNQSEEDEVNKDSDGIIAGDIAQTKNDENMEEEEEYDFPLFASSAATVNTTENLEDATNEHERGRPKVKSMKVSLREASLEIIKNERPSSYYFAQYSETEKANFASAAISGDDIYAQVQLWTSLPDPKPWKVFSLNEHNNRIEQEISRMKIRKTNRAGKNRREEKIKCRERRFERMKIYKREEEERKAKLLKKIHRKRGGKKHKKKAETEPSSQSKSKPASKPNPRK
ncbi:uncharacterized protein RJT20DRAFT_128915 [Scheffersomyces xylosifermentans]|uniref:uncharacterized protein n=1 Tax=Scheffersomyces xylosifermentans TaxID=1304137 RepID=UPI00315D7797